MFTERVHVILLTDVLFKSLSMVSPPKCSSLNLDVWCMYASITLIELQFSDKSFSRWRFGIKNLNIQSILKESNMHIVHICEFHAIFA